MSKSKIENYPYVEVPGVNKYLLDYMMLHSVPIEVIKQMVSSDKKLDRQLNQLSELEDLDDIQYLLQLSELIGNNYNFYNEIANITQNSLLNTSQGQLDEFLNFEEVVEACEWLFGSDDSEIILPDAEICEWVTLLRLYKKGKFAEKYIPSMLENASWLFYLETSLNTEDFTGEDDWKNKAYKKSLEDQVPLPFDFDQDEESKSFSSYKNQIISLLELMEESVEAANPETIQKLEEANEKLQNERNQLNSDLSETNKKLKNRDSQIQKLQREVSNATKSEEALQKKNNELKKQNGLRDNEIGQLRKEIQELTHKWETAEKSLKRLKDEQQSSIHSAEKAIENHYKKEIAKLQLTSEEDMQKIVTENALLTERLENVQQQVLEASRTQIEIYVNEIKELKLQIGQLRLENQSLQQKIQQVPQIADSNEQETLIDADLMDQLLISKPIQDKAKDTKSTGLLDEDDFAVLFGENKPK